MQGSAATREAAIDLVRAYQEQETHPFLRSEYSMIEGEEVFIPYPSARNHTKKKSTKER